MQIDDESQWPMNYLLPYPALLSVLLAARGRDTVIADANYSRQCISYSLNDVIIPDNYAERVEFVCAGGNPEIDLSVLPDGLKNAIAKRYFATRS